MLNLFSKIIAFSTLLLINFGCQQAFLSKAPTSRNAAPTPFEVIQDRSDIDLFGPEMVLLPIGEFLMGSAKSEPGRDYNEGPQHKVVIAQSFYLGKTEVTVEHFRTFIEATDYVTVPEQTQGSFIRYPDSDDWIRDQQINWRYDNRGEIAKNNYPVVNIAWSDAIAYVKWLSTITGKSYRLPTEAELEYAIRAGSTSQYPWGDNNPVAKVANIKGEKDLKLHEKSWYPTKAERQKAYQNGYATIFFEGYGDGFSDLSPVGSFPANAFGLFDTVGNVWEWTQDCYHSSYVGAPNNGSAWLENKNGDCLNRMIRGGSYYCFPKHIRSANRWSIDSQFGMMYIGFRLARDIIAD